MKDVEKGRWLSRFVILEVCFSDTWDGMGSAVASSEVRPWLDTA